MDLKKKKNYHGLQDNQRRDCVFLKKRIKIYKKKKVVKKRNIERKPNPNAIGLKQINTVG